MSTIFWSLLASLMVIELASSESLLGGFGAREPLGTHLNLMLWL